MLAYKRVRTWLFSYSCHRSTECFVLKQGLRITCSVICPILRLFGCLINCRWRWRYGCRGSGIMADYRIFWLLLLQHGYSVTQLCISYLRGVVFMILKI